MSLLAPTRLETFASYVPNLIIRLLARNPRPLTAPVAERFPAAVLFADMSGFTSLSERLTDSGPAGVEELSNLLNLYFGLLIDLVLDAGGDIVEFTGDGIIALWPTVITGESLADATTRAATCASKIQQRMAAVVLEADFHLTLRISIGAGEVLFATVGGVLGRWELLVAGDPLSQGGSAERYAQPGDVVLAPQAWALVQDRCIGMPLEAGYVRLEDVHTPLPPTLPPPAELVDEMLPTISSYIPGAVLDRLAAGQTAWLAELRYVTIIFLKIGGLNYAARDALDQAQNVMRTLQTALYHYEGSVNQFIVDDKGTILVAALGLPPLTHQYDAVLAVQAAQAMHTRLHQHGFDCAIGIATGWVFCGARGSDRRRDYAMIGDVMNLAARLMQVADQMNQGQALARAIGTGQGQFFPATPPIICDQTTFQEARNQIDFVPLTPVRVKGKTEPIPIYCPSGTIHPVVRSQHRIIGRENERALLHDCLHMLHHSEVGSVVVLEGEVGMGKSRLLSALLEQAQELRVISLVGTGDAINRHTSYHAWRPVFMQVFHLEVLPDDPAVQREHVIRSLASDAELQRLAPLINAVLPLDIPDNAMTAQMTGQVRADNTRRLLLRLLRLIADHMPVLLVLDEAHFIDSASWELALQVVQAIHPLLLLISTRPLNDPLPREYQQLLHLPNVQRVLLEGLSPAETHELVCQRLGVAALPDDVLTLLLKKSQGNPFFSEELAYALREAGVLLCNEQTCRLAPDAAEIGELDLPSSVQGIVNSRIDRLLPEQQLTIKVASVIGHTFAYRTLRDIYPLDDERSLLPEYLLTLERIQITALATPEPNLTYMFKHIIIQEVVYNLLLFSQRRELHRAVAEWYEQTYADDLSPYYPLLAHHWSKAEVASRALDYLEQAGEQALRSHANREAARFFRKAIVIAEGRALKETDEPEAELGGVLLLRPSELRRARWERQLGLAYLNMGNLATSRAHLEKAVAILSRPMPRSRSTSVAHTLRQIVRQTWHQLRRMRQNQPMLPTLPPPSPRQQAITLETSRAYEALVTIYFFANQTFPAMFASLRNLNLAERAGPSSELARAYANMCMAASTFGLHRLARAYARRAIQTAEQVGELATLAAVQNLIGLYYLGRGEWVEVRTHLEQALDYCDQLGDLFQWGQAWTMLAQEASFQGDFPRADEMFRQLASEAHSTGNRLHHAWALGGQGQNALHFGDLEGACTLLAQANTYLVEADELPSQISNYGLLAQAWLRRGNLRYAEQATNAGEALLKSVQVPLAYYLLAGYAGFAQVHLWRWEHSTHLPYAERTALHARARTACAALATYAQSFPIGKPRLHLCQGLYTWLSGNPAAALKLWQTGLQHAETLGMRFEQSLLHAELGRHTLGQQRRLHLAQAQRLLAQSKGEEE